MASGIFKLRDHLYGLVQKSWYNNQPILPTLSSYLGSLNGSSQYITWTGNMTGMQFGTGDFTIEAWVNKSANGTNAYDGLMSYGTVTQGGDGWYIECSTSRGLYFSSNSAYFSVASAITNDGLWHHIAVVRASGVLTFYKDGQNIGSTSYTTSIPTSGTIAAIGKSSNGATNFTFNGLISNARIVKGTAVYTSNFNPPTSPLTAIANTQILTLQGPTIVDNSSNSTSLTNNGSVGMTVATIAVNQTVAPNSNLTPYVEYLVVAGGGGGGSCISGGGGAGGLLQGVVPITTGSSITVTVGAGGTGNSTGNQAGIGASGRGSSSVFGSITATGGGEGGYSQGPANDPYGSGGSGGGGGRTGGSGGNGISGQGNAGGSNPFNDATGAGGGGAGTVGMSCFNSSTSGNGGTGIASSIIGTVTAYAGGGGGGGRNGTSTAGTGGVGGGGNGSLTAVGSNGTANTGGGAGGGGYDGTYWGGGNGGSGIVAISYPDTYNAPTTLSGTYTASTSGSGSISLNGSSQYIATNNTANLGAGNFTIEFWFNIPSITASPVFLDTYAISTASWQIYTTTTSKMIWYSASTTGVTGSNTFSVNTWNHYAVVRSGTIIKAYLNGVLDGFVTDSTNYNAANTLWIGAQKTSGPIDYVTGNMTNVRIVVGTAIYTSNFTPPTAPLTAISGTQYLLSAVSGAPLADSSGNGYVGTVSSAAPTWNQASPFATGLGYKNRVYTWTASGTVTF